MKTATIVGRGEWLRTIGLLVPKHKIAYSRQFCKDSRTKHILLGTADADRNVVADARHCEVIATTRPTDVSKFDTAIKKSEPKLRLSLTDFLRVCKRVQTHDREFIAATVVRT